LRILYSWVADPFPHYFGKLVPDPYKRQNSGDLKAQNGAVDGRGRSTGGSKWNRIDPDSDRSAFKWCRSATLFIHVSCHTCFHTVPTRYFIFFNFITVGYTLGIHYDIFVRPDLLEFLRKLSVTVDTGLSCHTFIDIVPRS
jgi:hypothetical protein